MKDLIELILGPLKEVYETFTRFFPNLLAMLIIILIGIMLARVLRFILMKLLSAVSFDSWSDRMGLTSVMRKGDLWARPSAAVGAFVFWLLIIVAMMAGLSALKVQAIDNLVSQFVLYLPRVISAVLILVFGYIVTAFIGRAVLIWAVNRGYHFSKLFAEAVRLLLVVLFVAMALEQLRVAPSIVAAAFSIIFGGIILALSISFGVGGIEAAKKIIEQETERKPETKRDIEHI
jgi:Mechanosensitive ion channel, conserved TM helix